MKSPASELSSRAVPSEIICPFISCLHKKRIRFLFDISSSSHSPPLLPLMSTELWGCLLQCIEAVAPVQVPMNKWAWSRRPSTTLGSVCWPCCNVPGTKLKGGNGVRKELPSESLEMLTAWHPALMQQLLHKVTGKFCLQDGQPGPVEHKQLLRCDWEKMSERKTVWDLPSVAIMLCQGVDSCLRHMWYRARMSYPARLSGRSFAFSSFSLWSWLLRWMLRACTKHFLAKPWRAMCSQEPKSRCFDGAFSCDCLSFLWPCRKFKKPSGSSLHYSSQKVKTIGLKNCLSDQFLP